MLYRLRSRLHGFGSDLKGDKMNIDKRGCKILMRSADEADVLLLKKKRGIETTA